MRRSATIVLTIATLACCWSATGGARAQDAKVIDARENPFLPTSTDDEERRIQERERMRQVVREMYPETKSMIQVEVNALKGQISDETRRTVTDMVKSDPTLLAVQAAAVSPAPSGQGMVTQGQATAAAVAAPLADRDGYRSKLPDGARFIACVNMKALYRDAKDGVNFFYDPPRGSPSNCS